MPRHCEGIVKISQCQNSCLSPSLRSQVRGQILGGDNIPTLTATFSRIMRISTGVDVTTFIEQSAMASRRGRGRGRGS